MSPTHGSNGKARFDRSMCLVPPMMQAPLSVPLSTSRTKWMRGFRNPRQGGSCGLTPFLGPAYDDSAIDAAIAGWGFTAVTVVDPAGLAASLLAEGQIVGWFQGRMEFGPRALGGRSLLADPRRAEIRDLLNRRIKHRESFRPFGARSWPKMRRTGF